MEILDKIKPSKEEIIYLNKILKEFLFKLNHNLKDAKAVVGGSFAKNTFLKGNKDIDIFVQFKEDKDISDKLEKVIKKTFRFSRRVHGSRDYFHVHFKGILFEVVPVMEIKSIDKFSNITDISPWHVNYVRRKTSRRMQDEIRLLKQFLIANNLYGAESYIKGFSGYVSELLIIHYKSFNNLIKNVRKWKEKTIIDISKRYKNENDVLNNLNEAKVYSPLILVDPVQRDRNAAASLSREKYGLFIKLAKKKLNFEIKRFDTGKLKGYIILEVLPLNGKKDVVGAKMLKAFQYIKMLLNKNGFLVIDSGWYWNKKAYFFFKVKDNLNERRIHFGPRIDQEKHLKKFKSKYKKFKLLKKGKKVYVMLPRKYRKAKDFVKYILKDENITSKVKNIKIRL